MTPSKDRKKSGKPGKPKTAWQKHGGALFDHLSNAAVGRLKEKLGLNTEVKFVDKVTAATAMATTLTLQQAMVTVPQGTTTNTRTGSSFRLTNVDFRILIGNNSAAATNACTVRTLICRANSPTSLAASTVLQVTNDVTSPIENDFGTYGDIILDRVDVIGPLSSSNSSVQFRFKHKRQEDHVIYTDADTAGTVSNILEGRYYVFMMCSLAATVMPPSAQLYTRYHFVDN